MFVLYYKIWSILIVPITWALTTDTTMLLGVSHMKPSSLFVSTLLSLSLAFPLAATADEGHPGHHKQGMHAMHGNPGHDAPHKKKHHFAEHWSKTLSEAQKKQIDQMHLKLARDMAVVKAKVEVAQKELNVYTISDDANQGKINAMIDSLLNYDKEILRLRYAHLLEMRHALTEEQRISYDMGVIERSGIK